LFAKSQTLYNECALEIRKRFGGRKNFKEKYITILACKKINYKGALTAVVEHPLPTAVSSALASECFSVQYNFTYVQSFLNTLSEIDIAQTHGHSKIAVVSG